MTERDKRIEQAEALETVLIGAKGGPNINMMGAALSCAAWVQQYGDDAAKTLRALAAQQPEAVEPVAWLITWEKSGRQIASLDPCHEDDGSCVPLYTHPQASAPADFRDAYVGAREDLEAWKRRALAAEKNNRQLTRALQEQVNSPTFMGEPANGSNGNTSRMVIDGNSRTYIGGGGASAPADHTAASASVREQMPQSIQRAKAAVGVTPDLDALVDDAVDAGKIIEHYSHPSLQPLSKTDFNARLSAYRWVRSTKEKIAQAITDLRAEVKYNKDAYEHAHTSYESLVLEAREQAAAITASKPRTRKRGNCWMSVTAMLACFRLIWRRNLLHSSPRREIHNDHHPLCNKRRNW